MDLILYKDVQACKDPIFKQAQLYELDQMYWNSALSITNSIGAKNQLTLAFIYDMCVNHGADGAQEYINANVKEKKLIAKEMKIAKEIIQNIKKLKK